MLPIVSLLTVIVISMLVVRVATVALTLTGLSQPLARFQARSAFTGAGFTTRESEKVVGHPVRRRIILLLMLLGNAGIVTAVSSLILSFAGAKDGGDGTSFWLRTAALVVGLAVLYMIAHSQWIDRGLSNAIAWALRRWTDMEVRDYASLLHLSGDYAVAELAVNPQDWLAGRTLSEVRLSEEGILVLGIDRADGTFVGAPRGGTELHPDDTLLLYGSRKRLRNLDQREAGSRGNWEHVQAVDEQVHEQAQEEPRTTAPSPTEDSDKTTTPRE